MDQDVLVLAQVLAVIGTFATFAMGLALVARYIYGRTEPRTERSDRDLPPVDEARFARLEDAVDSIAIEVERIAEAQRFSVKLMAERLPERLPRGRERGESALAHRSPIPE